MIIDNSMRSQSTKDRILYKKHSDTQKFIENYDYIPQQNFLNKNGMQMRGCGSTSNAAEHNRSQQMAVIQNKRHVIEEIKREENMSMQKDNMSSILSGLKSELGIISKHIKDTNSKVDNYLQKASVDDYLTNKIRNKKYNFDYSSTTNEFHSTNQKSFQNSNSLSKFPIKQKQEIEQEPFNQFLKATKRNDIRTYMANSTSNSNVNPSIKMNNYNKKYQPWSYIQDNSVSDKSFTYQYELQHDDNSFEKKKPANYTSSFKSNACQDQIVALQRNLESSNKILGELTEKANYYQHNCETIKKEKEKMEHRCSVLENELIEAKQRFLEELQMKNNYLSMINSSSVSIEKNEQAIHDYEKQVKLLQKRLKEKTDEVKVNQDHYSNVLNSFIKENEGLKCSVFQLESQKRGEGVDSDIGIKSDTGSGEYDIRQLNEMISTKQAELTQAKFLNDELNNKINVMTEKYTNEKNELINKMAQMNLNDNRELSRMSIQNDNARLIEKNAGLKDEIAQLRLTIDQLSLKAQEKVDEDINQQYNSLIEEYKRYKTETNLEIESLHKQLSDLIETNKQFKFDSEPKNAQINLLSSELNIKKAEVSALTKEIEIVKEQNESMRSQLEHKTDNEGHEEKINELTEVNSKLHMRIKELEAEVSITIEQQKEKGYSKKEQLGIEEIELNNTIVKLRSELEVYQNELQLVKERNDIDNEQMQKEFNNTVSQKEEVIASLRKKIDELSTQLQNEQSAISTYESKSKEDSAQLIILNERNKEYQSKCVVLSEKLVNIEKQTKDKAEEDSKEIQRLLKENEELKNEINSLNENQHLSQTEFAQLKLINTSNENTIASSKVTIRQLESELDLIRKSETELRKLNNQLVETHKNKTTEIESELIKETERFVNELKIQNEEMEKLKTNEARLQKENEFQAKAITQLEQEIIDSNSQMKTELASKAIIISELTNEINAMKQEEDNSNTTNLQLQLDEKDKRIKELTDENNQMVIEIAKIQPLETQNQKLKTENQTLFIQLKAQLENNEALLTQLDNQKEEIDQILSQDNYVSKQIIEGITDDLLKSDSFEHHNTDSNAEPKANAEAEDVDALYSILAQCKETIINLQESLNQRTKDINALEELVKNTAKDLNEAKHEIEEYKKINDKLIQTNSELKASRETTIEKSSNNRYRQSLTNAEELNEKDIETLQSIIENLRELVNEKDEKIMALQAKQIEAENTNEEGLKQVDQSLSKLSASMLTDAEKCAKYKERIELYKAQQQSDQNQIVLLKKEIKELNTQLAKLKTFEGRITSYEEFIKLYQIAIENYKPKKKEQEEALKKIEEHLSLNDRALASEMEEVSNKKQKKGIFNKLFK